MELPKISPEQFTSLISEILRIGTWTSAPSEKMHLQTFALQLENTDTRTTSTFGPLFQS